MTDELRPTTTKDSRDGLKVATGLTASNSALEALRELSMFGHNHDYSCKWDISIGPRCTCRLFAVQKRVEAALAQQPEVGEPVSSGVGWPRSSWLAMTIIERQSEVYAHRDQIAYSGNLNKIQRYTGELAGLKFALTAIQMAHVTNSEAASKPLDYRAVLQPFIDEYTAIHKARRNDPKDTQPEVAGAGDYGIVTGLQIAVAQLDKADLRSQPADDNCSGCLGASLHHTCGKAPAAEPVCIRCGHDQHSVCHSLEDESVGMGNCHLVQHQFITPFRPAAESVCGVMFTNLEGTAPLEQCILPKGHWPINSAHSGLQPADDSEGETVSNHDIPQRTHFGPPHQGTDCNTTCFIDQSGEVR